MDLEAGILISERYRLERLLGRGGMGVVWAAEDIVTHARHALKLMRDAGDDDARRRFLPEARAAAAVRHPNVVSIVDVFELADGSPVIAMELLDGESLRVLLEREGKLAVRELAEIALPVISAVGAAHALGIVHRDLKPENIFLSRGPAGERVVKVLDFGIAKLTALDGEAMQSTGLTTAAVLGTPAYMAPEQVFGETDLDHRADIWALGIIIYQCLSGVLPTQGDNIGQVLKNVVAKPFEPLGRLVPDLPEDVSDLVAQMLAHERSDRPADLQEVAARLEPFASHSAAPGPVKSARRPAPPPTTSKRSGGRSPAAFMVTQHASVPPRKRRVGAIAGAMAVAAVGVAAAAAWRWTRPSAEADETGVVHSALDAPTAKIACPILLASGVDTPAGWLGAAAAATACERARVILGGRPDRTIVPAELLGVPRTPIDDPPSDRYGETDARDHSLLAARRLAAAYLDGQVVKQRAEFWVTLELRTPDAALIERAEGRGRGLYEAVRNAMTPLVNHGVLPTATQLDPEIAAWSRTQDVDAALATLDLNLAMSHNAGGLKDECRRFEPMAGRVGQLGPMMRWLCAYTVGLPPPSVELDGSDRSPAGFATWLRIRHLTKPVEAPDEAKRLHDLYDRASSPWSKSLLAALESCLVQATDPDLARNLALRAVADEPKSSAGYPCTPWGQLVTMLDYKANATRAMQAWEPWNENAWLTTAWAEGDAAVALRRAYDLAPFNTQVAGTLADKLFAAGKREEARGVAIELAAGGYPVHRLESEILLLRYEASEARFGRALARAPVAWNVSAEDAGWVIAQRFEAAWRALEVAAILGRARELADQLIEHTLSPDPPRLEGSVPLLLPRVAAICALASPGRSAQCFGRLQAVRSLLSGTITPRTDDFIRGAERYAKQDDAGAAREWRPLLREPGPLVDVFPDAMATVFDHTREPRLAEQVDVAAMRRADDFNGATLAHARAAQRAARRGDLVRARALATKLVDAWQFADDKVPAAGEMQRLLVRLPAK